MSKRRKQQPVPQNADAGISESDWQQSYQNACSLADQGDYVKADEEFARLIQRNDLPAERKLDFENDRAVLAVLSGQHDVAREKFAAILHRDPLHVNAWLNLRFIDGNRGIQTTRAEFGLTNQLTPIPKPESGCPSNPSP